MDDPQAQSRKGRLDSFYNAIAILMAALIPLSLTFALWQRERIRADLDARTAFEFRVRTTTDAIRARMSSYEQALRGAAALFATEGAVTRDDWREYLRLLDLTKPGNGLVAISYAPVLPADRLTDFNSRIPKSEISSFRIWPKGSNPLVAPTLYVEPFIDANLALLGFDLYSDPVRASALERSRDTGAASVSGFTPSAANVAEAVNHGAAMYVPIYRRGTEPGTVEQRRTTLVGFVTAAFDMDDLLNNIVGKRFDLDLQLIDAANSPDGGRVLAHRHGVATGGLANSKFSSESRLTLNDRLWTLRFASTPAFERLIDDDRPRLVLISGLGLSAVLLALFWALASTRNRAMRLARRMTGELRDKQQALAQSEERLSLALQGSDLAIFDWDMTTGAVQLSEQWAAMLGGKPEATLTTAVELSRLVHPDDVPALQKELLAVVRGESAIYRVEHRVRTAAGDWLWVLSRAKVAQRDAAGRALRIAGTNVDITARKLAEDVKRAFVGTVSHELRTPLTVIVGALGLLKADLTGLTAEQKMMLDMACDNSGRLQVLVNDILDFEKITSGAMQFTLQPVAVESFLQKALELNRIYAERLKVRYRLNGPVPAISVNADPDRLMQVMANLLSNAAKFSPENAEVTVTAAIAGERVRISVSDGGPGVPAEFRERIFGKFAQADASNTRRQGGTGLGLSICKAIVEKLGGTIGFDSEPGQGAIFWFELQVT